MAPRSIVYRSQLARRDCAQELRAWAAKRGKDEVELIQARSKIMIKEVRKLLTSGETTGAAAVHYHALPGPSGGKAGGRF